MHATFTNDPSTLTAHQVANRMRFGFFLATIGVLLGAFRSADASATASVITTSVAVGLLIAATMVLRTLARGVSTRRLFAMTVGLLAVLTITAVVVTFEWLTLPPNAAYLALLLAVPVAFSGGMSGLCLERGLDRSAESWRTLATLFALVLAGALLMVLFGDGPWSVDHWPYLPRVVALVLFLGFAVSVMLLPLLVPWAAFRTVQAQRERHIGGWAPR